MTNILTSVFGIERTINQPEGHRHHFKFCFSVRGFARGLDATFCRVGPSSWIEEFPPATAAAFSAWPEADRRRLKDELVQALRRKPETIASGSQTSSGTTRSVGQVSGSVTSPPRHAHADTPAPNNGGAPQRLSLRALLRQGAAEYQAGLDADRIRNDFAQAGALMRAQRESTVSDVWDKVLRDFAPAAGGNSSLAAKAAAPPHKPRWLSNSRAARASELWDTVITERVAEDARALGLTVEQYAAFAKSMRPDALSASAAQPAVSEPVAIQAPRPRASAERNGGALSKLWRSMFAG